MKPVIKLKRKNRGPSRRAISAPFGDFGDARRNCHPVLPNDLSK
jgi:hypothetical protein